MVDGICLGLEVHMPWQRSMETGKASSFEMNKGGPLIRIRNDQGAVEFFFSFLFSLFEGGYGRL